MALAHTMRRLQQGQASGFVDKAGPKISKIPRFGFKLTKIAYIPWNPRKFQLQSTFTPNPFLTYSDDLRLWRCWPLWMMQIAIQRLSVFVALGCGWLEKCYMDVPGNLDGDGMLSVASRFCVPLLTLLLLCQIWLDKLCLWLVSGLCSTMSWLEADAQAVRIRLYHDTSMHEQFPHVLDLINAWNGKRLSFLVFIFIPWTHCWTSAAGIIVPQSFAGEPFMFVWSLIGFPLRSTSFGASKPARSQNAPPQHTGKGPVSTFPNGFP